MRPGNGRFGKRAAAGFTLFEMVVVVCSIAILYMVAEQRLNELPAAAERANFLGVLDQIKTGVNFAMYSSLASGDSSSARAMENSNPMNFLVETPANYRGELELVTDAVESRNAWYFETSTGQLVYVVGGASIADVWVTIAGVPVNLGQIRMKVVSKFSGDLAQITEAASEAADNENMGKWQGLVLAPVYAYQWESRPEQPVELNPDV